MSNNENETPAVSSSDLDTLADEATTAPAPAVAEVSPGDIVFLSRKELLSYTEIQYEVVPMDEFFGPGRAVRVRSLRADERDAFEASLITGKGKNQKTDTRNLRAKLVALTAVAGDNSRLMTMKDVEALGKVNAAAVDKLYSAAARLSGITEKDVEELAGNSANDQLDAI